MQPKTVIVVVLVILAVVVAAFSAYKAFHPSSHQPGGKGTGQQTGAADVSGANVQPARQPAGKGGLLPVPGAGR